MILVDNRAGSRDLAEHLPKRSHKLTRLEFGDVSFLGSGPDSMPVAVGIELKRVGDAVDCIHTGRFAGHQLPGMQRSYQVVYLIVEGRTRRRWDGLLQWHVGRNRWVTPYGGKTRRGITLTEFRQWLLTLECQAGVRIWRTESTKDTASLVTAMYKWWIKPWDKHKSLHVFDDSRDFSPIHRPTLKRRIAAQLSGVGWERSQAVARHFGTVREMLTAPEETWREIPGIGATLARRITNELQS